MASVVLIGMLVVAIIAVAMVAYQDENEPKKGSWEIGFIDPENNESLDFFVNNFSEKNGAFSYEIKNENVSVDSGIVSVDFRETKEVAITEEVVFENGDGVYFIVVSDNEDVSREIYRQKRE